MPCCDKYKQWARAAGELSASCAASAGVASAKAAGTSSAGMTAAEATGTSCAASAGATSAKAAGTPATAKAAGATGRATARASPWRLAVRSGRAAARLVRPWGFMRARGRCHIWAAPAPPAEKEGENSTASVVAVIFTPAAGGGRDNNDKRDNDYYDKNAGKAEAAAAAAGILLRNVSRLANILIAGPDIDGRNMIIVDIPAVKLVDKGLNGGVIIAAVKIVPEIAVQILSGDSVRKAVVYAGAGGEPALALACGGKEEHAIVFAAVADAPVIEELVCIFVGVIAVQIFNENNSYLSAGALIHELLVSLNDHLLGGVGENAGSIRNIYAVALRNERECGGAEHKRGNDN